MSKTYTSNTEDKRLNIEEPVLTKGQHILPQQIWRDGALIPGSPDLLDFKVPELEDNVMTQYAYIKDGQTVIPLVAKLTRVPLKRVQGTLNVFHNDKLVNLIGREFDSKDDDKHKSWRYVLFLNNEELAYDIGEQRVDTASGDLYFTNKDFINKIKDDKLTITFYKYVGRAGFIGVTDNFQDSYGGIDIPFRDDIKLIKDADNDDRTANFVLYGHEGNTVYILPSSNQIYVDENIEIDDLGRSATLNNLRGTVMLQENYQEIDWQIGLHNGGNWLPDGSVMKN